jgi:hypothetical protein
MNIKEITEGRVSDMAINRAYDMQHNPGPDPVGVPIQMDYSVTINGKVWKDFPTESDALKAANALYAKNRKLRVNVVPK